MISSLVEPGKTQQEEGGLMEGKWHDRVLGALMALGVVIVFLVLFSVYYAVMSFALQLFEYRSSDVSLVHGLPVVLFAAACIIAVPVGTVYVVCRYVDAQGSSDEDEDGGGGGHGNIRRWPYTPSPGGSGLVPEPSSGLLEETHYIDGRPVVVVLAPQPAPRKTHAYN